MLNKLREKFRKHADNDGVDRIEINRIEVERVAVEVDETTKHLLRSNQELLKKLQNGIGH